MVYIKHKIKIHNINIIHKKCFKGKKDSARVGPVLFSQFPRKLRFRIYLCYDEHRVNTVAAPCN